MWTDAAIRYYTYLDDRVIAFEIGPFFLDTLISAADAPLVFSSGHFVQLLCYVKFDCLHIFNLFTLQGVHNSGEEEKDT
jgi:hypothetical protein